MLYQISHPLLLSLTFFSPPLPPPPVISISVWGSSRDETQASLATPAGSELPKPANLVQPLLLFCSPLTVSAKIVMHLLFWHSESNGTEALRALLKNLQRGFADAGAGRFRKPELAQHGAPLNDFPKTNVSKSLAGAELCRSAPGSARAVPWLHLPPSQRSCPAASTACRNHLPAPFASFPTAPKKKMSLQHSCKLQ